MVRSVLVTSVVLAACCMLVYLVDVINSKVKLIIYVQSEPPVSEMLRVIQDQKAKIDYLSTHIKVVYRCPDDIPPIKYPRQASDDLTEAAMTTDDECGDVTDIDAVIIVHTAADHFERRQRFRKVYADYRNTKPYRLKVVFLIGSVLDAHVQIKLEIENRDYGDTVVGTFQDKYQNLTLKAVMGYRWLTSTCPDIKLLIKMDDDVFFDVGKFFTNYWQNIEENKKKRSIHCYLWHNAKVFRTGKWKVEKGLFANASYPFPYCSGFFVVVSPDLIKPMYMSGKSIDFFWIDDVFLYGMVPAAIKGVQFFQLGANANLITDNYGRFTTCMKNADKCSLWAAVTNGESEFDQEYKDLVSRTLLSDERVLNHTRTHQ